MGQRNIRLIYIYTICTNLVFILPIVVPYYKTIGLTFADFMIAEAVFAAVVICAEVPSGWISDVWRRKTALMGGLLSASIGYGLLMFADSLIDAIIAQGIIGIAVAMNSGTVTAMLYDTLLMEGREGEYRKLEGKRHAIGLYSTAFGAIVGAIAYSVHPKLPLQLDLIAFAVGIIAMAMCVEPVRAMKAPEKHMFRDMLETILYALRGHKEIAGIILVSMVLFCSTKLMLLSQQPYFEKAGIPVEWFGIIMAAFHIAGGLAGHWSHKLEPYGSNKFKLTIMACAMVLACLILSATTGLWYFIPFFVMGTMTYGIGYPIVQSAINSMVGSERRATILSTASLMVNILLIPASLAIGYAADFGGIEASLGYLGLQILILGGIGLWLWKPKDPVRS
jgi:MFS family permease